MLLRIETDRVVAIAQPAHAALSGQLARSWGNHRFGAVEPFDDVVLGAQLHDIGWLDWELAPALNPATGLPYTFMQLSTSVHLEIWRSAAFHSLAFGRYPALLTSLHFTGLYERFHDYDRDSAEEARDARALVASQLQFQRDTIAALRRDVTAAEYATDSLIDRNRQLIALWDGMSLAICQGIDGQRVFRSVPTVGSDVEIVLDCEADGISVEPWPFTVDQLLVSVDGRVLHGPFADQNGLDADLAGAEWTTVSAWLRPATSSAC